MSYCMRKSYCVPMRQVLFLFVIPVIVRTIAFIADSMAFSAAQDVSELANCAVSQVQTRFRLLFWH